MKNTEVSEYKAPVFAALLGLAYLVHFSARHLLVGGNGVGRKN